MQLMIAWINYLWATTWLKPCVSGWWMLTNSTDPKDIQRHWSIVDHHFIALQFPLVNIQKTMENHHFQWVNPRTKSPCSIAILTYPRVSFPILCYRTSTQHRQLLSCSIKAPLLLLVFPEEETSKEANEKWAKKGLRVDSVFWPERCIARNISCVSLRPFHVWKSVGIPKWFRNLFPASREVIIHTRWCPPKVISLFIIPLTIDISPINHRY